MNEWPSIRLGEVIQLDLEKVQIDPSQRYQMVGVLSFGRGLFEREPIENGNTSYKYFLRLKQHHIVMSQLFGWEGALALSEERFEGKYLSPQFPTFRCRELLDRQYLGWLMRRPAFWDELGRRASGMGDRRRTLTPESLLSIEIPLPPLSEQRRVVARIEEVAGLAGEVNSLHEEVAACDTALEVSLAHRRDLTNEQKQGRGWELVALAEVIEQVQDRVAVRANGEYPNFGILSFGRGLFRKPAILGLKSSAQFLNRVHAGQFIYSRLFAFEGAYGQVTPEFDGWFVSNEYPTFRCDPERVLARFLVAHFKPKEIWRSVAEGSKGLGDRRQRVQPPQILKHKLWLPPIEVQRQAERIGTERSAAGRLRRESSAALDALLPAVLACAFRGEL